MQSTVLRPSLSQSLQAKARSTGNRTCRSSRVVLVRAEGDANKELLKSTRQIANTFAPRASGATGKNPAVKGTVLYDVFVWQGWISAAIGGLLSFNVLFPSDEPDIWRLMGMWSVWMFTIPSLRAKECDQAEKDVLNILFLGVPILNIILPFIYKSFAFVWSADMVVTLGIYWFKYWSPEAQVVNAEKAKLAAIAKAEEEAAQAAAEAQQQEVTSNQ